MISKRMVRYITQRNHLVMLVKMLRVTFIYLAISLVCRPSTTPRVCPTATKYVNERYTFFLFVLFFFYFYSHLLSPYSRYGSPVNTPLSTFFIL
jgi:hypothetical protein